jgi:hypothetical protein
MPMFIKFDKFGKIPMKKINNFLDKNSKTEDNRL